MTGRDPVAGTDAVRTELDVLDNGEDLLGGGWDAVLAEELGKPYLRKLLEFVAEERADHAVFPPPEQTFRAFGLTPFDRVRAVILGQDPYPTPGNAVGLAFAVGAGVRTPASLANILTVLAADLTETRGHPVAVPAHLDLAAWAEQGVLLLNAALTVSGAASDDETHRQWRWEKQGWSTFTDAVIRAVSAKPEPVVFLLWGADARKKQALIDTGRNHVITSSHPSPLSAWRGFLDSRPFSATNAHLRAAGLGEIAWLD